MNAAFYAGREQTLFKHMLLQRYLKAAVPIIGSWADDLYYVDCLAGPWENVDPELSDTSFSIALETLKQGRVVLTSRGKNPSMRALFVEENREAFLQLAQFAASSGEIQAVAKNWDFTRNVDKIVQSVARRPNSFPFFFIDPTGWDSAAIPVIKPLLQVQPGEVLINLMTSWISRFLPDTTKPFHNLLGPGFETIIDLEGDDREEAIVMAYTEAVRAAGDFPYVCTMPVLKSTNEAFHFHMVYATRSPKGVEEFKRAEDDILPFIHGVRADAKQAKDLQRTGQHSLLSASETYVDERHSRYREANSARAEQAVMQVLRGAQTQVPYDDLWAAWMQFACVQDEDLQAWLSRAVRNQLLRINNLSSRAHKCSRNKGITITRLQ